MSKTCYNCGTENASSDRFCRECGADLGEQKDYQQSGLQAGPGEERVLWDNGEVQVTTEAVLIGMKSDSPDVVPLSAITEVKVEDRCVVMKVKNENDRYCMLDDPTELSALIKDQMMRPRLAQSRKDKGYIPPD